MTSPWVGIALVLGTLLAALALLAAWQRLAAPHPEVVRKALHVAMGLVALAFPWLFAERWPVVVLAAASLVAVGAARWWRPAQRRYGPVLRGVRRVSCGDLCFAPAVAGTFVLADGDRLLYLVPVLLLALADAAAGVVGALAGRIRFATPGGTKSLEGSAACLVTAFTVVDLALRLLAARSAPEAALIALVVAVVVTLLEAVAPYGLDNLAIPLGAVPVLRWCLGLDPVALALAVVVAAVGLGVLAWALSPRVEPVGSAS